MDFDVIDLARHLDALDLKVPTGPARILAMQRACNEAIADRPVDDLAAALEAGEITPKNAAAKVTEAAMRLATHDHAQQVVQGLQRSFGRTGAQATREAGNEIIAELRSRFDPAIAELATITDALGATPTKDVCFAAGPAATELWLRREDVMRTLADVRRARLALARAGYGPGDESVAWWATGIPTMDAYRQANEGPTGSKLVERLATAGYTMHLATADEVDAMLSGYESAAAEAQRRQTEAQAAEKAAKKAEFEQAVAGADPAQQANLIAKKLFDAEIEARRAGQSR